MAWPPPSLPPDSGTVVANSALFSCSGFVSGGFVSRGGVVTCRRCTTTGSASATGASFFPEAMTTISTRAAKPRTAAPPIDAKRMTVPCLEPPLFGSSSSSRSRLREPRLGEPWRTRRSGSRSRAGGPRLPRIGTLKRSPQSGHLTGAPARLSATSSSASQAGQEKTIIVKPSWECL